MTVAFVQGNYNDNPTGGGPGTTTSCAYTSNTTAGNTLIAIVTASSSLGITSVTDPTNGTWTLVTSWQTDENAANNYWTGIYYVANCAGGACTVTGTYDYWQEAIILLHEFSGVLKASPLDGTGTPPSGASFDNGSSTSWTSGALTIATAGDLLIGCGAAQATGLTFAGGWTLPASTNVQPGTRQSAYQIAGAAGSYALTGGCNSGGWGSILAAFKAYTAGAVVVPRCWIVITR